eukprot:361379-Chlamydomonas_euryale.AAC.2
MPVKPCRVDGCGCWVGNGAKGMSGGLAHRLYMTSSGGPGPPFVHGQQWGAWRWGMTSGKGRRRCPARIMWPVAAKCENDAGDSLSWPAP